MKNQAGSRLSEDILNEALAQERKARDFYTKMSARCQIDFVRELMESLEDDASKHIRLIEGMLAQIGSRKRAVGGTTSDSPGASRTRETS